MSPILGIVASQNYPRITNSFESIQTVTVGAGGQSSISFTSIPSTYKHLQIRGIIRNTAASNSSSWLQCQANGDTSANYTYHLLSGNGTSASAGAGANQSAMLLGDSANNGTTSGVFAPLVIDVLDYTSTSKTKTFRSLTGVDTNSFGEIYLNSGLWNSTSAISSLTFWTASYNLAQYSSIALYGIKG